MRRLTATTVYLEEKQKKGLYRLAKAADRSVERMLARLEETNRRLDGVIRTVGRSNRRALEGRR